MSSTLKKILIIDDDRVHLFTIQKLLLLSQKGVQLKSYRDGRQAFNYLQESADNEDKLPDIILLDLNMPGWDGWKFLLEYGKLLHRFPKKIKLYIVSSSSHPEDVDKAFRNTNVSDYITKPLSIDTLNRIFSQNLVK